MVSLDQIGVSNFSSYNLKGKLFEREEDFIVQEIEEDGRVLSIEKEENKLNPGEKEDYLVFTLVKRGLSTPEAVKILSKDLHINQKRIAYNGNKDKKAITSQRMSIFKLDPEKMVTKEKRLFFRDIEYSKEPCRIGRLYGNRFTVFVDKFDSNGNDLNAIKEEVVKGIPNFYGPQRFGSSSLNIDVSRKIIRKDFKNAFYKLVLEERNESAVISEKRKELREIFFDYFLDGGIHIKAAEEALSSLPRTMYYEKEALSHILAHKNDYIGAIRLMPKYTRLLILQSYQYYLFNRVLSKLLFYNKVGQLPNEIYLIGYDSDLSKNDAATDATKKVMEEEGIESTSVFKIKAMPEASLKTFNRPSYFIPENFSLDFWDGKAVIKFDLMRGSYATILLVKLFGINSLYKSNE